MEKLEYPVLGLTLDEAAAVLRVDRRSVVKSMKEDGLPYRKVGRSYRIGYQALQDWINSPGVHMTDQDVDME